MSGRALPKKGAAWRDTVHTLAVVEPNRENQKPFHDFLEFGVPKLAGPPSERGNSLKRNFPSPVSVNLRNESMGCFR